VKKVIRSAIIFWGIVALFPFFYFVYLFFTIGEGSYWLFGAGDGQASAITWLDSNANGVQESDEKALANVCLWSGYRPESGNREFADPCEGQNHDATDDQGKWGMFLPGGRCDDFFIFARVPEGFQATTDLASNGCEAAFGFALDKVEVKQRIRIVEQFVQQQTTFLWAKRIAISLIILVASISGTIWLQKNP